MSQKPKKEAAAESAAQNYVTQEFQEVKVGLQRLQIGGSIAVIALAIFLGGIAQGFSSNLEPKEASKIARGYIAQQMESGQVQLTDYLKTEIPAQIEQAPEYALAQLPEMRENLENELEAKLQAAAKSTSDNLSAQLDNYMEENKNEFKTIILAGQDKDTTDEVAQQTKNMFMAYLNSSSDGTESIQEKFDKALEALDEVDQKTSRLANGTDLTDTEKKTRRALAVMFGAVNEAKANTEIPTKADVQGAISSVLPAPHEEASAPAVTAAPTTAKPTPSSDKGRQGHQSPPQTQAPAVASGPATDSSKSSSHSSSGPRH